MKENPHHKITTGGKNKKIRKKKSGPDKKEKFHLKTQTSIVYEPELEETVIDTVAIRQYRQQLDFAKNFIVQVAEDYDFRSEMIQEQRDSLKEQLNFPTISIDKLFDHKATTIFNKSFDPCDLTDYLKLVNNQLHPKRKKIILNVQSDSFLMVEDTNRHSDTEEFKGRFITLLEKEVFQNRQNFMEKIQQNQSKYQHCNSQLSEISQELLFLAKMYRDNSSKIKKLGDELALKMSNYFSQPQFQTQKLYYEVIMKKNIAYAIKEHQIDFLNYFRQREHEERNSYGVAPDFKNEIQFFAYLKSKKPKKGKPAKYGLPTACSCCFSSYFEPVNPLIPCENCNLRCHKLCYNLKQKSCGNCSYQRLLKTEKQTIPNCIICRKKGEMTIKLRDKVYAHAFCLIIHNQWEIYGQKVVIQQAKRDLQKESETSSHNKTNILLNLNQSSNSYDKKFQLHYQEPNIDLNLRETIDQESHIESQMKCQDSSQCKVCCGPFHQNLHVTCCQCHKKSHAFCAFFEGQEFKPIQNHINPKDSNNRINVLFDCCSKSVQEKEKLKKSREFVLNRNRFLFENL